jgi:hypothetical protein
MTNHRLSNYSNTAGVTSGVGTVLEHMSSPLVLSRVHVTLYLVFCVVVFISLFVLLSFFHLAIMLFVIFRLTDSDYPFGVSI